MRIKLRAHIFFIIFLLSSVGIVQAQSISAPSRVEIAIEALNPVTVDSVTMVNPFAGDSVRLVLFIDLAEVTGVESLHVKVGNTSGGDSFLNKEFAFDVLGNLGDGTTYKRTGKVIILGIGSFYDIGSIYAEVRLEDTLHNLTAATSAVFNP